MRGAPPLVVLALSVAACSGSQSAPGATDAGSGEQPDAQAECAPTSCEATGAECGLIPDGCGGVIECPACQQGECGIDEPNMCGTPCTPKSCEELGADCGEVEDGCGEVLSCGECAEGFCGGGDGPNTCGEVPCEPTSCAAAGADCGQVSDGCSLILECGTCGGFDLCGGAGVNNVCGCATGQFKEVEVVDGVYGHSAAALDGNDGVHVIFVQWDPGASTTVLAYGARDSGSGAWSFETIDESLLTEQVAMAIDPAGTVHAAWIDQSPQGIYGARYARRLAANDWAVLPVEELTTYSERISISVSAETGTAYLSYPLDLSTTCVASIADGSLLSIDILYYARFGPVHGYGVEVNTDEWADAVLVHYPDPAGGGSIIRATRTVQGVWERNTFVQNTGTVAEIGLAADDQLRGMFLANGNDILSYLSFSGTMTEIDTDLDTFHIGTAATASDSYVAYEIGGQLMMADNAPPSSWNVELIDPAPTIASNRHLLVDSNRRRQLLYQDGGGTVYHQYECK